MIDNPYDAVSLHADREPAAPRDRRHVARSGSQTYADGARASRCGRRSADAEAAGVGDRAAQGASRRSATLIQSLHGRRAQELEVAELVERVLERSGYLEALEAERTIEAQGRIENLQELVGVAQRVPAQRAEEPSLSGFLAGDLALLRPGRDPRRAARSSR